MKFPHPSRLRFLNPLLRPGSKSHLRSHPDAHALVVVKHFGGGNTTRFQNHLSHGIRLNNGAFHKFGGGEELDEIGDGVSGASRDLCRWWHLIVPHSPLICKGQVVRDKVLSAAIKSPPHIDVRNMMPP
ncbi:MAG: hypothetical protein RL693_2918, partial [Verrucomicrobiota bacterium]